MHNIDTGRWDMALRFFRLCLPAIFACSAVAPPSGAQILIKTNQPGERVMLMPSDLAILESDDARHDLPCTVNERKPGLGFDLRFHSGYEVTLPLRELAGSGEVLTILSRVHPRANPDRAAYFVQHFRVPEIEDDAKGEVSLQGVIDLGEGKYHVDWMMRDRLERICSSGWDVEAALPPKDKPMPLFLAPNEISEALPQPFVNEGTGRAAQDREDVIDVKLLVNFAPQDSLSAALQRTDTDALVSILKAIERDPHIGHVSLVAFNIEEGRVIYRQESAQEIDFPALGKALDSMKLGTVNVVRLGQKHSETDFLQELIEKEIGNATHPDAVIFAGPKAMLDADVPQEDLRRIGNIECPVFYMNYNLNPQAVPWKDSISHAIRAFKGTEFTISQPRDLWLSTTEMVSRIVRLKRNRALTTAAAGGSN
ncbi:MAG: acetyltransferase [Bryobacteraceae bacterium]